MHRQANRSKAKVSTHGLHWAPGQRVVERPSCLQVGCFVGRGCVRGVPPAQPHVVGRATWPVGKGTPVNGRGHFPRMPDRQQMARGAEARGYAEAQGAGTAAVAVRAETRSTKPQETHRACGSAGKDSAVSRGSWCRRLSELSDASPCFCRAPRGIATDLCILLQPRRCPDSSVGREGMSLGPHGRC